MAVPYLEVFGVLLVGYMAYSFWERIDPRYPIAAGLLLLVATAVTEALGASASADVLAEYVFLLLGAGVVLLLLEQLRGRRNRPATPLPQGSAHPEEHSTDPFATAGSPYPGAARSPRAATGRPGRRSGWP